MANFDADSRPLAKRITTNLSEQVAGGMECEDGATAATEAEVVRTPSPAQRRPGRPPGSPKPPTSGRKKGVPNKSTREIREIAQKHGGKAVRELVKLMTKSENDQTRLKAAVELLDRAYGRPITPSEINSNISLRKIDDMSEEELTYLLGKEVSGA